MTTTPQAALLSAQNPLLKRCYTMSEPHLSGYRVVIGFERLEDAQDAHEYIAKLQAKLQPAQAGELPIATDADLDMMDKFAREHNVNAAFFPIDASTLAGFVVSVIDEIRKHRAALSARKPLNSAQIRGMAIQEQFLLVCDSLEDLTCIVREVERAHGIGLEVKP